MQSKKERLDDAKYNVKYSASDIDNAVSNMTWIDVPDAACIEDAGDFDFNSINFNDLEEIQEAVNTLYSFQSDCSDAQSTFEQLAEIASCTYQALDSAIDALYELVEILEEEEEIEVGLIVKVSGYGDALFRVLAVAENKDSGLNYAWVRDVAVTAEPMTTTYAMLTVVEEARAA